MHQVGYHAREMRERDVEVLNIEYSPEIRGTKFKKKNLLLEEENILPLLCYKE